MISKKMEPLFQNNSGIRAMFEEGLRMAKEVGPENVFDFSLGNPNIPAPADVGRAIKELVDTEDPIRLHGYMPNQGFPDVRKTLADALNRKHGTAFTEKNLIMAVGAASALNMVLKTILDDGDEVIVFAPYFVEYGHYIRNYGGVPVTVHADETTFLPDMARLREKLNAKTKAVIINTPNNPTGVVYPAETLKALSDTLSAAEKEFGHPIVLISDEPYRELVYDGKEVPYVTKFYNDTAVCYSYSKSLSLPGERIGYVVIPDEMEDSDRVIQTAVIANRIMGSVNAPSLMQKVVAMCVDTDLSDNVACYDRNRKELYRILKEAGFEALYPEGAFYMWIKTPVPDKEFVALCKKHYILVVPGSSFEGSGYVRAAYCVSEETIKRSEKAWRAVAEELRAAGKM